MFYTNTIDHSARIEKKPDRCTCKAAATARPGGKAMPCARLPAFIGGLAWRGVACYTLARENAGANFHRQQCLFHYAVRLSLRRIY